jgi:hypothetical protein
MRLNLAVYSHRVARLSEALASKNTGSTQNLYAHQIPRLQGVIEERRGAETILPVNLGEALVGAVNISPALGEINNERITLIICHHFEPSTLPCPVAQVLGSGHPKESESRIDDIEKVIGLLGRFTHIRS